MQTARSFHFIVVKIDGSYNVLSVTWQYMHGDKDENKNKSYFYFLSLYVYDNGNVGL